MNFAELLGLTVDAARLKANGIMWSSNLVRTDLVLISPTKTPQISNSTDPPELLPVDVMIPLNRSVQTPFFCGLQEGDVV